MPSKPPRPPRTTIVQAKRPPPAPRTARLVRIKQSIVTAKPPRRPG